MSLSLWSLDSKPSHRDSFIDNELMLKSLSDEVDIKKHINTLYDVSTDEYSILDQNHLLNLLEQPKYVKVYKRSKKSGKMFQRLFFAQELKPDLNDSSSIWVMKFSKDGKYLLVGRQDGSIVIWKVISSSLGRLENQMANNTRRRSMSGSSTNSPTRPNSSVQTMSSVGVNDIGPDRSELTYPETSYSINNAVFAPIFETKPIRHYKAHSSGVISLDWSKNNFLISGSMDNTAKLWHIDRENSLHQFIHEEFVTSVNFHPRDDRFFLSACMDSKVRLWSILEGSVSYEKDLPGLITAATFTPDGNTCVAGGLGWCSVLDTKGLDKKYDFHIKGKSSSDAHGPKITGIELFDEMDNGAITTKLLITTNDSRIRKFNLSTKMVETKFKGLHNDHSQIVAEISENKSFVISGSENHWCYIWSLSSEGHLTSMGKAKEKLKKLFGGSANSNNDKKNNTGLTRQISNLGTYKNNSYLVFHAHHTDVTCALFAPVATSKLIELSQDPLFELYTSYQLYLKNKLVVEDHHLSPKKESSSPMAGNLPLHKNTIDDEIHPEFSLIVTADKHGVIRVFRRDFVYNIRKAIKHDYYAKYKGRKPDLSDNGSIISSTRPPSSTQLSRDVAFQSFISSKPPSINTESFVPLGLGSVERDDYSLSSDSSLSIKVGRSHTAKERPLQQQSHGSTSSYDDKSLDTATSAENARGRKRINSLDDLHMHHQ